MASSFSIVTRARLPAEELFDVSLSIDEHVASMAKSGERAVEGVTRGSIALGEAAGLARSRASPLRNLPASDRTTPTRSEIRIPQLCSPRRLRRATAA